MLASRTDLPMTTTAAPAAPTSPETSSPVATPDTPNAPAKAERGPRKPARQGKAGPGGNQRTSARKAPHPVLEKLFELHPQLFGAQFLPLKRGSFQDLMDAHPGVFEREALKVALGLHTRSTRYLECVAAGKPRHSLQGEVVEAMAPEHVHQAIVELFHRRQSRTAEDLRPQFVQRLVVAVDTSGLDRDAYAALVSSRDEAANALLDAAFAEIGAQHARQDALLRAFEGGTYTEAQFADMYGLTQAAVALTLEKARRRRDASAQSE